MCSVQCLLCFVKCLVSRLRAETAARPHHVNRRQNCQTVSWQQAWRVAWHGQLYTLHVTLYTVHVTLYIVYCTLYTLHSTLCTVQCTVTYSVECSVTTDVLLEKPRCGQSLWHEVCKAVPETGWGWVVTYFWRGVGNINWDPLDIFKFR